MLQGGTEGQGAVCGPSLYTRLHYMLRAKGKAEYCALANWTF